MRLHLLDLARRTLALGLIVCLFLPAIPRSSWAADSVGGVVIFSGSDSSQARTQAVSAARWKFQDPANAPWQPVAVESALEWGDGRAWVVGVPGTTCKGDAVAVDAVKASLQAVRTQIDGLLLTSARQDLELVEAIFPCVSDVLSTKDITAPFFLRGVLEYYEGKIDAAASAFRGALSMDGSLQWDESYSPEVKSVFEQAQAGQAVASLAPAKVRLSVSRGASGFLDGKPSASGLYPVAPGRHVFQVKKGSRVSTAVFEVPPAREVFVYDGESAWSSATVPTPGTEAAGLLASLAKAYGKTRACAWTGARGATISCWDEKVGVVQVADVPEGAGSVSTPSPVVASTPPASAGGTAPTTPSATPSAGATTSSTAPVTPTRASDSSSSTTPKKTSQTVQKARAQQAGQAFFAIGVAVGGAGGVLTGVAFAVGRQSDPDGDGEAEDQAAYNFAYFINNASEGRGGLGPILCVTGVSVAVVGVILAEVGRPRSPKAMRVVPVFGPDMNGVGFSANW